jgi:hypothetical protein
MVMKAGKLQKPLRAGKLQKLIAKPPVKAAQ